MKMIKVKSIGYQQDNVAVTVEYSIENEVQSFTVYAKLLSVYKMTLDEIKQYLVDRVESQRSNKLRDIVADKLGSLVEVDLEEETV